MATKSDHDKCLLYVVLICVVDFGLESVFRSVRERDSGIRVAAMRKSKKISWAIWSCQFLTFYSNRFVSTPRCWNHEESDSALRLCVSVNVAPFLRFVLQFA